MECHVKQYKLTLVVPIFSPLTMSQSQLVNNVSEIGTSAVLLRYLVPRHFELMGKLRVEFMRTEDWTMQHARTDGKPQKGRITFHSQVNHTQSYMTR